MVKYSGCDVHKKFSVFVEIDEDGVIHGPTRVDHHTGELEEHLESLPEGTPIAVETCGHWFWMVDRIEAMGHQPRLVNAQRASQMMGHVDKTDSLDAQGLAVLQQTGTLPEVWIPEGEQRDRRELLRLRLKMVQSKTRWKNRIQATLMKYGLDVSVSDAFGSKGREQLEALMKQVPEHSQQALNEQLRLLDRIIEQIDDIENQLEAVLENSRERSLLTTMPGIGRILSAVLVLEIGDIDRFPGPGHLASYSGVVPGVHASGGKRRTTGLRNEANQTLKWAYMEAANAVVRHQHDYPQSRLVKKYRRLSEHKPSGIAKGAVARMLAESTYWVLTKDEPYEEPDGWSPP